MQPIWSRYTCIGRFISGMLPDVRILGPGCVRHHALQRTNRLSRKSTHIISDSFGSKTWKIASVGDWLSETNCHRPDVQEQPSVVVVSTAARFAGEAELPIDRVLLGRYRESCQVIL